LLRNHEKGSTMGKVITHFHSIECNGPAPTPLYKHCPMVAQGDWDEATVEANAIAAGWTASGQKWLCPTHSPVTVDGGPPKAPRKPKAPAAVAPAQVEQPHQDNQEHQQ
jgi:hypothetical protein